jgi:putative flippase GtrA
VVCGSERRPAWWRQLLVYATVGLGVFCVDFSLFLALSQAAGLSPLLANPISRTTGGVASFCGHRFITFARGGARTVLPPALRFLGVYLVGLALSQLYLGLLHHVCGVPAPLAKPLGEGLVFFGNFLLLGWWAFA